MVKIEATFPKQDNEGNLFSASSFHYVESYLLESVGGYTVTECSGGWADGGKTYLDHSFVYSVVVDDMGKANAVMANLKWLILNDFRQHSAWITYHDISVF